MADMTIEELAERVGVPVRTIRFYITEQLLPSPEGRGRSASYGREHLLRLSLIRRLVEQRVPLAEIRARLAGLSLGDLEALLAEEERRARGLQQVAEDASPKEYISALLRRAQGAHRPSAQPALPTNSAPFAKLEDRQSTPLPTDAQSPPAAGRVTVASDRAQSWQRWELAPGVELHVRADAAQREHDLIEHVLRTSKRQSRRGQRDG